MKVHLTKTQSLALTALTSIGIQFSAQAEPDNPVGPIRGDNPDVGIKYDKNQGLRVTPISAKILNLKLVDVEEKEVSGAIDLQIQIYEISGSTALGSAWLGEAEAKNLFPGKEIELTGDLTGTIKEVKVDDTRANELVEVIAEITAAAGTLKPGKFLAAKASVGSNGKVFVVPKDSVLKTAEGIFAYVDNAGWIVRTEVTPGLEDGEIVEIIDGVYPGDLVVSSPVMSLWMTELQLLKSGKA